MLVWVMMMFELMSLLSLVQVSYFSLKLALDNIEIFKNPLEKIQVRVRHKISRRENLRSRLALFIFINAFVFQYF